MGEIGQLLLVISHHHREGNRVADYLANHALGGGTSLQILQNPPHACIKLLRDDMSGASFPRIITS